MTFKTDALISLRFTSNKVYVVQFLGPKSLEILLSSIVLKGQLIS